MTNQSKRDTSHKNDNLQHQETNQAFLHLGMNISGPNKLILSPIAPEKYQTKAIWLSFITQKYLDETLIEG